MVNELKFPKYKHTASGRIYTCIGFTVDLRSTWEWYAFEDEGNGIYFGYVMGFENEFGSFSEKEFVEAGVIPMTKSPQELRELMPPIGFTRVLEGVK